MFRFTVLCCKRALATGLCCTEDVQTEIVITNTYANAVLALEQSGLKMLKLLDVVPYIATPTPVRRPKLGVQPHYTFPTICLPE